MEKSNSLIKLFGLAAIAILSCVLVYSIATMQYAKAADTKKKTYKIQKTDAEWRKKLTPEQYHILREKGTEYAWTGKYNSFKGHGVYHCAGCNTPLFHSDTKFDSGTGWPSFYKPYKAENVATEVDTKYGMVRTEVLCGACGGHLGHVFKDGPEPTGLRYCINSLALHKKEKKK